MLEHFSVSQPFGEQFLERVEQSRSPVRMLAPDLKRQAVNEQIEVSYAHFWCMS